MGVMATVSYRELPFAGHRVGYVRAGAGRPMLLVPNAVATHRLWEHQIEHFRTTHDVIAIDTVGLAAVDRAHAYPVHLYVRLVHWFIDGLGLESPILVGNCIGSLASLHYAALHPDAVSALVLMNMHTRDTNSAGALGSLTRAALRFRRLPWIPEWYMRHLPARRIDRFPYLTRQFGDLPDREYGQHLREIFDDPAVRMTLVRLAWSLDSYVLPSAGRLPVRPPVCWIWGEKNRILPLRAGDRTAAEVRPTEQHVVTGAGHATARERPDLVNTIIEAFLTRHLPDVEPSWERSPAAG